MTLFLLDYGAGNVCSLANSLTRLGHSFRWIQSPTDFESATCLIFPGVGAFQTAVQHLADRQLLEPLRAYIKSGKPYFGICIGMQILFESSTESSLGGLAVIPCPIRCFESNDKTVPHIGWNAAELVHVEPTESALDRDEFYYFVHSYRAEYDPLNHPEAASWAYTTTQYGQEIFISSIRKGAVFGTQFHPEKSAKAGLALVDDWIRRSYSTEHVPAHPSSTAPPLLKPRAGDRLTKRIIACMDVRANDDGDLVVTKGDQYDVREKGPTTEPGANRPVRNLGKPIALAERYFLAGADEICLLNITSFRHSPLLDQPMLQLVQKAAESIFVPLTIGGGIKDTVDPDGTAHSALEVAGAYFRAGADKVSIGSEAVFAVERLLDASGRADGTSAIERIASVYGSQAVVVSVDPRKVFVDPATYDGPYVRELVLSSASLCAPAQDEHKAWYYQCTVSGGRVLRPLSVVQLVRGVETLGAGEILLNSIDRDGAGAGFDLDLVGLVKRNVTIPVVASSGAGRAEHFVDVFDATDVEAALAAGIFHREEVTISEVKNVLKVAGINVRR